jgi:hypothetical protein
MPGLFWDALAGQERWSGVWLPQEHRRIRAVLLADPNGCLIRRAPSVRRSYTFKSPCPLPCRFDSLARRMRRYSLHLPHFCRVVARSFLSPPVRQPHIVA